MQDGIHQLDIQEVDLCLGGVDIDVDVGRVHFYVQEISWEAVAGNHLHIGVLDGMVQIGMLDETLVHEEILLTTRLLGIFRLDDVAVDAHALGLLPDGQQAFLVVVAEQAHDALLEVARIEMIYLLAIAGECEAYLGVHQRDTCELLHDVPHLCLSRLEEIASCGDVEKQVLHRERGARLHRHEGLFLHHRAFVDNLHPHFVFLTACLQLHLRDGGDARQGLATETHGADGEQVLRLADFGSGVSLEAHAGVGLRHTAAVVDYHDHRLTGIFHDEIDLRSASIQGILHQLFDGRCRTLDHLACRNLVGDAVRQKFDDVQHTLITHQAADDVRHQRCAENEIEQESHEDAQHDSANQLGALFFLAYLVFGSPPTPAHLDSELFLMRQLRVETCGGLFLLPCLLLRVVVARHIVEFLWVMSIKECHCLRIMMLK